MKTTLLALLLTFLLSGGIAWAQKKSAHETSTMKTIRLHIDGFMKSKSGAV
jgi:hypothetical protein